MYMFLSCVPVCICEALCKPCVYQQYTHEHLVILLCSKECRDSVPAPDVILPRLDALMARTWEDSAGRSLFTQDTLLAMESLKRIVRDGRVSGTFVAHIMTVVRNGVIACVTLHVQALTPL